MVYINSTCIKFWFPSSKQKQNKEFNDTCLKGCSVISLKQLAVSRQGNKKGNLNFKPGSCVVNVRWKTRVDYFFMRHIF